MTANKKATSSALDRDIESNDLDRLRQLLLAANTQELEKLQQQVAKLEHRLSDPDSRTNDTSEILVHAVRKQLSTGEQLGNELKPVVVEQFRQTSKDDPEMMAEALFPILGPAIRKMIAAMLTPDSKSKKRTYRLEQLFLIEKETGLPLCHVSSETAVTQDADMVSGMLSAIQSFVHEAFAAKEFDGLNTLQVGDLSVWIEWGPSALLAAVIRGNGPEKLREAMQLKLEEIHHDYATQLRDYEGDTQSLNDLKPELHHFLDGHDSTLKNKVKNLPVQAKKWLTSLGIALACLVCWILFQSYDRHRWDAYVAEVESQPGIVVTKNERRFRSYVLRGLKDPMAQDPEKLLAQTSLNTKYVTQNFEPYQAINSDFVLARAHAILEPPADVELTVNGSILIVTGGNASFVAKALRIGLAIVGIDKVSVRN